MRPATFPLVLALLVVAPSAACAQELRPLVSFELGAAGPMLAPDAGVGWGGTLGASVHLAIARTLIPALRLDALALSAGSLPEANRMAGTVQGVREPSLASVVGLALRWRPRGVFHPEEPQAAGCVWAEIVAGAAAGSDLPFAPAFEAAIGFLFVLPEGVDLGPVFRLVHVLAPDHETVVLTMGVALMLPDAPS